MPTPADSPTHSAPGADTRSSLLRAALHLFAQEGIRAVALRRIVQAAGAANPSALHYHFGNRDNLVTEVTRMLQAWLEPKAVTRLEQMRERPHQVRDVMEAVFGPVLDMLYEPALGLDGVRFIGRLGWDYGEIGQRLSAHLHQRTLELALESLTPLLPALDRETLQFRLVLSMNTVYYGISYRNYLHRSPFGALPLATAGNQDRQRQQFMDYLEAGMRNVNP